MSDLSLQIVQAENEIAAAKQAVELRAKLARLKQNPDFRDLIEKEYMNDEAIRCLGQSADMANDQRMRADALSMAQATGHLRRFLIFIDQMGAVAMKSIGQHEELLEELRAEEDAQGQED